MKRGRRMNVWRGSAQTGGLAIVWLALMTIGCAASGRHDDAVSDPDAAASTTQPTRAAEDVRPLPGAGKTVFQRPTPPPVVNAAVLPRVLLVDDLALTVDELLYFSRQRVLPLLQSGAFARSALTRLLRAQTQQEIGTLVLYAQARRELDPSQMERLRALAADEVEARIAREYEGSSARFERALAEFSLTREQHLALIERDLIARLFARDRFTPQVFVRRAELLRHYRANLDRFSKPETRELLMIEIPFEAFLPERVRWERATPDQRAAARDAAAEEINAAYAALAEQPFDSVARQFSRDPFRTVGGMRGEIGSPLQPPYDTVSARLFEMQTGDYTEPHELPRSWCIVGCGLISAATQEPFEHVQDVLRYELTERRIEELSQQHMQRLVARAEISPVEPFVEAAVRRALSPAWPTN